MAEPKSIILWVHPRSCSTMFESALLTRGDEISVLHEPMGEAWYFSREKQSARYSDQICKRDYAMHEDATFAKTWAAVVPHLDSPASKTSVIPELKTFSKDMAYYIFPSNTPAALSSPRSLANNPNPTLIPTKLLLSPSISHTFLIRSPVKAIPSFSKLCFPGSVTGFDYFDAEEAGYSQLKDLFDFIRIEQEREGKGSAPMVVDSEELLKEPERIMQSWCEEVGIRYSNDMLHWDETVIGAHFAKWPGFHCAVEGSIGVNRGLDPALMTDHTNSSSHEKPSSTSSSSSASSPSSRPVSVESNSSITSSRATEASVNDVEAKERDLRDLVRRTIEDNMVDYEYLKSFVRS